MERRRKKRNIKEEKDKEEEKEREEEEEKKKEKEEEKERNKQKKEKQEQDEIIKQTNLSSSSSISCCSSSLSSPSCSSILRSCDNKLCQICLLLISFSSISICIPLPYKKLKLLSKKTLQTFHIKWNYHNILNYFHLNCWNNLKNNYNLNKTEKLLIKSLDNVYERYDTIEIIQKQIQKIGFILKNNNNNKCVIFTGAGISANAGIPTYRGVDGIDTIEKFIGNEGVVPTSTTTTTTTVPVEPSKKKIKRNSTKKSNSNNSNKKKKNQQIEEEEEEEVVEKISDIHDEDGDISYEKLSPTFTHNAITLLQQNNYVHYCITQNCDNLHLKSNFPRNLLTELHGNVFCEYCELCQHEYYRDYSVDKWSTDCYNESWYVECPKCSWNHYTSRICEKPSCNGKLRDTIVNFGDDLFETVLGGYNRAENFCQESDLCIAMGSSLTVSPANSLPLLSKQVVVCNLQPTELDELDLSDRGEDYLIRCWTTSDIFMKLLLNELGIS